MTPQLTQMNSSRRGAVRGFSLIELLVVMGIIGVLAAMTTVGYRAIAKDAKLASGKNTIMAVLDQARSLAMRDNQIVMVVFRPRMEGTRDQYIEAIFCKWTGQSHVITVNFAGGPGLQVIDRFVPIPTAPVRPLPRGVQIAGPRYRSSITTMVDEEWNVCSFLPAINQNNGQGEAPGMMLGVMYSGNGTVLTRNSRTDSHRMWVDLNNDGIHDWNGITYNYNGATQLTLSEAAYGLLFDHHLQADECYVDVVPFLAVFDDETVRSLYNVSDWNMLQQPNTYIDNRRNDYTAYINANADRIHFNRYTGVAMK